MNQSIGFIGLGKMGRQMVLHLLEQGIPVVGFNRTKEVTENFVSSFTSQDSEKSIFTPVFSISDMVSELATGNLKPATQKVIWLMVPNGQPVDDVITQLVANGLQAGDTIIDGGNCFYKDSVRRAAELTAKGIHFIDCGTSGGMEGARNGACLMLGGEKEQVEGLSWLWKALSGSTGGYAHFGKHGAGHFVKMVHNGVEYGMNQAIGEGFEILAKGPYALDLHQVAENWTRGSVVRGWLMELLAHALSTDGTLDQYSGAVGGGETGRWTVETAKTLGVQAAVLEDALQAREQSQTTPRFAGKVVSALRFEYGGHK